MFSHRAAEGAEFLDRIYKIDKMGSAVRPLILIIL